MREDGQDCDCNRDAPYVAQTDREGVCALYTCIIPNCTYITIQLIAKRKKFLVHDESNSMCTFSSVIRLSGRNAHVNYPELLEDDQVVIRNCPPVSARKRFTLERVLASPAAEAAAIAAAATRGASNSPSAVVSDLNAAQARAKQAAKATQMARKALEEAQRLKAAKEAQTPA